MAKIKPIDEALEQEFINLDEAKQEVERLKTKWFKLPSTEKLISFLEFYVELKKEEVKKIEDWKKNNL